MYSLIQTFQVIFVWFYDLTSQAYIFGGIFAQKFLSALIDLLFTFAVLRLGGFKACKLFKLYETYFVKKLTKDQPCPWEQVKMSDGSLARGEKGNS